MPAKTQRNHIHFPYALKSFMGYLEGTKKSVHTIKNYKLDILSFETFLRKEYPGKQIDLEKISRDDLERYRDILKEKGLKTNTRRRKLLTVTQFLGYLAKRKKLPAELGQKMATPHKIEKIPFTVSAVQLKESILKLPHGTILEARNRALLWALAETGCLVSEVTQLRYENWMLSSDGCPYVQIRGKLKRSVPVSMELFQTIRDLKSGVKDSPWIFLGFNKYGSLGAPITPRGVEMLVKLYGPRMGFAELTPRIFRHSIILKWFEDGVSQLQIQERLGLKTTYAFRSYETLVKSNLKTTSNSEKNLPES